jgi:hypothetical protein
MHLIELKVHQFLEKVSEGKIKLSNDLYINLAARVQQSIKNILEVEREFSFSISSIGRDFCYLQNEFFYVKPNYTDSTFPIRGMYGYLVEALLVFLIRASGINILADQETVAINIDGNTLNGTLDLALDLGDNIPTIWDIKSASHYSFVNKFENINSLIDDDPFGYITQLWLYTEAKRRIDNRTQIGGFIAFDKSSGDLRVIPIPQYMYEPVLEKVLDRVSKVFRDIETVTAEKRPTIKEKYRKKMTGREYLDTVCQYCKFKFNCFPNIQLLPNPDSTANNPIMRWYITEG